MKTIKLLFLLIFTLSFSQINAQSIKAQERQNNKVKLFSDSEFANLHIWFYNEVQKMNLSENADNEYSSILNMHVGRMSRLDDKDKGYSKEEMIKRFNEIFDKLNIDIKPVLNENQFTQHIEIMNVLSQAILNKLKLKA
ncbi:hypothetical protein A9Q87_01510 [Flavobacteriales bacterium 34_180_T64]|nr:hypothetical protein A9Q87_01510 [Flavobacteriales bacterium 34_180_T64]